nr:hypothetical protein [Tanacetum cinerariifolium]
MPQLAGWRQWRRAARPPAPASGPRGCTPSGSGTAVRTCKDIPTPARSASFQTARRMPRPGNSLGTRHPRALPRCRAPAYWCKLAPARRGPALGAGRRRGSEGGHGRAGEGFHFYPGLAGDAGGALNEQRIGLHHLNSDLAVVKT